MGANRTASRPPERAGNVGRARGEPRCSDDPRGRDPLLSHGRRRAPSSFVGPHDPRGRVVFIDAPAPHRRSFARDRRLDDRVRPARRGARARGHPARWRGAAARPPPFRSLVAGRRRGGRSGFATRSPCAPSHCIARRTSPRASHRDGGQRADDRPCTGDGRALDRDESARLWPTLHLDAERGNCA